MLTLLLVLWMAAAGLDAGTWILVGDRGNGPLLKIPNLTGGI